MGYPKMVWGMRKRGSGHRNKGAEVEFWGVEGREMGFIGLVTRPKSGKRRKGQSILQFSGHGKWHHILVENMENHTQKPLSLHCI